MNLPNRHALCLRTPPLFRYIQECPVQTKIFRFIRSLTYYNLCILGTCRPKSGELPVVRYFQHIGKAQYLDPLFIFGQILAEVWVCVTLEHKSSVKSLGYICSNSQQYIVWDKIINFSFMSKFIRILSKDHVP